MYLFGASGHAKVIIEILEMNKVNIDGLFDDNPQISELLGYTCTCPFGKEVLVNELIISIGVNPIRKKVSKRIKSTFGIAIHPSSQISIRATVGDGTVIMANSVVNSGSAIGKHVILNTSSSIDHDCIIEDFVHISPNATLCGGVFIGEGSHIGAGAILIPGVKVGKWATIGAGSVVLKDVPDNAVVVGNPGQIIKFNYF